MKISLGIPFLIIPVTSTVARNDSPVIRTESDSVTAYAPAINVQCPDLSTTPLIRIFPPENQTLHPDETKYVSTRQNTTIFDAWREWLGDGSSLGYNTTDFGFAFPKIGVVIPGGGLRAAQYGASSLLALDARNASSKAAGTGGLLQVSSYMAGLSGGSWLMGSLLFNNFPTLDSLVFGDGKDLEGWLLDIPFVTPDGSDIFSEKNQEFFGSVLWSVISKADKGIDTSITDVWSRLISYHFLNQTTRSNFFSNDTGHGAGQLWSKITQIPAYQNHLVPFPIVVADSRPVGSNLTTILPLDSVVYEITPLEIASYDPFLSSGMNLSYAGTHLHGGRSVNGSSCIMGFDQAGFIMGTSASLFNQILDFGTNALSEFSASDSNSLLYLLSRQLSEVQTRANDVANWPNPFQGLLENSFQDSESPWIELIDGSSNQENTPYGPLLAYARNIDVIVTLEGSADDPVNNWPNGTSLIFSTQRQATLLEQTHKKMPPIPLSAEDFISTGINARPTFFGCDPSDSDGFPLIIYLPNAPPFTGDNPVTNTPTFQLTYSQLHTHLFFDQVYSNIIAGFVPNTNLPDSNWGKCLQCAAIDRARNQTFPHIPRSTFCSQCFNQYCYNPSNLTSKLELPNRRLVFVNPDSQGLSGFIAKNKIKFIGVLVAVVVLILMASMGILYYRRYISGRKMPDYQRIHPQIENFALEEFSIHLK